MRVNIYAEEITDRIEVIEKVTPDGTFTGLRFYLELPVSVTGGQVKGPFMHNPGDDDSAAVTFWGKQDLRIALNLALDALDDHYDAKKDRVIAAASFTYLSSGRGGASDSPTGNEE